MKTATRYVIFYLFWIILNGNIEPRTIVGGVIACIIVFVWMTSTINPLLEKKFVNPKLSSILHFYTIVFSEIFHSAFRHIGRIIKGEGSTIVFRLKLDVTDPIAVALIANAITLTPGTITLDSEKNTLTVMSFAVDEKQLCEIKLTILNRFQKPFLNKYHQKRVSCK